MIGGHSGKCYDLRYKISISFVLLMSPVMKPNECVINIPISVDNSACWLIPKVNGLIFLEGIIFVDQLMLQ